MNQVLALQTGKQLKVIPGKVCEHGKTQVLNGLDHHARLNFEAMKRMHAPLQMVLGGS